MYYLLDTHTLIWFINGDKNLSSKARKAIESIGAQNYVSIASIWEIAIKISLDRLDLKTSFDKIGELIDINNFSILPISINDGFILSTLPFHHKDPFDRMIISQSISNKLTIISKDNYFRNYEVKVIW